MVGIRPSLNYPDDITYGDRFSGGDGYEYRFVTLPKVIYLQYRKILTEKKQQGWYHVPKDLPL